MDERKIIEKGTLFLKKHFIAIIIAEIIIGLISLICAENNVMKYEFYMTFFFTSVTLLVFSLIAFWAFSKIKITVTDKRVFGCVAFGRKVELPLDSISAVGLYNFGNGIAVATSSGKIKFALIKDSKKVYNEISKLLINRQKNEKQVNINSNVSTLKEYKELLDIGAITQEEFDQKKKEILSK